MIEQQIFKNLAYQFPQLPLFDITLITQTVASMSLLELKVLKLNHRSNATMIAVIESVIQQLEAETELTSLEAQHQDWEDYRHYGGHW